MSAFIKGKLKLLKEALGAKDWTLVDKLASDVLSFESSNYNARVFRSLALFNLERFDEAEESYKKAIEISPSQPLARQGLASFYEKRQRWSDFAWSLLELMQLFLESDEPVKYAETLQKLIDVRRSQGTRPELISALSHLLPYSPSVDLLSKLPPPNPTAPTASTVHAIQLALQSNLPTLLEVVSLVEAEESNLIETEIKKRRQRLGGQTLSAVETRKLVEGEYLARSQLVGLYQAVMEDPDASEKEELRREVEHKLLVHLRTLLAALPSSLDPPTLNLAAVPKRKEVLQAEESEKSRIRAEVENLAKGLVVIRSKEEGAWHVILEWTDRYAEWERFDWRELAIFVELFPDSGLSQIARASAARHHESTKAGTDEDSTITVPTDDEMVTVIETGLEASPDSLLAHLLAVHFFSAAKEWEAVVQISEAGLGVLARMEAECGRASPKSRRTLDHHLAIALVHHNSPTNHLRALRLIESLLSTVAIVDTSLLTAKAYILQSSEQWDKSISVWDAVLDSTALDENLRLEVQGERGWCLFEAGSFDAAVEGLNIVVEAFEARKVVRDEEMRVKQKIRSKAGIELEEGVQEGETTSESEQRAKAWWRLGKCYWELGVTDDSHNTKSYTAFVSSIRASSHYAPAFTSLGLYYRDLSPPDPDRALKCFQKAFELNGSEEVAARYLAEEFAESGDWDLVEIIARRVVDGNRGSVFGGKVAVRLAWAWKAIGGAELNSKKFAQAIVAFQSALRGAPDDVHTWIRLGVAYRASGKHVASLKVFAKALSLDPSSWYARFSIGDVQREIGLLDSAIKTFREILIERPEELGVLVVLSETLLANGMEEVRGGFTARAEESFVAALEMSERNAGAGLATRVAWKVVGDALGGLVGISDPAMRDEATTIGLRLLAILAEEKVDVKIEGMDVMTVESLTAQFDGVGSSGFFAGLRVLAYKMRILLETENDASIGSAWLDLGLAISHLTPSTTATGTPDEAQHQSIRCLKFALQLEPLNSLFWNALGVLSFTLSPRLSQHALIKSIEHSPRAAVPWTNLGLFYLSHDEEELANMAFLKAQVLDPDYESAWVGQAILAERGGEGEVAAGLWSHAFSLPGSSTEADVGFAISAFAQYRSAATTSAPTTEVLSAPLFALTRYLSTSPRDFHALHLQSLILEQIDDLPSSSTALELAASILEEIYEEDESPIVEARFVIAQSNLGRVRLAMGDWEGAKVAFEMGLSLLNLDDLDRSATPSSGVAADGLTQAQSILLFTACKLGMGLAQYSLGEMESAIDVWNGALEDLETFDGAGDGAVGRRADLDVALGKLHWSRGEEDLAMSSFLDSPDVVGDQTPLLVNMTMHAAGIVTADRAILTAAKRNADRMKHDRYSDAVNEMKVRAALVRGDPQGAVAALTRAIHAAPGNMSLRLQLLSLLLKISDDSPGPPDEPTMTSKTNLITPALEIPENTPLSERVEMLVCVAVGAFLASDRTVGEKALQKAIFLAPSDQGLRRKLERIRDLDI